MLIALKRGGNKNLFQLQEWYSACKTQQLEKSKGNNVIWANTTFKGVNHMEQRNHFKTKEEFRKVFAGQSYGGNIFMK